MQYLKLTTTNGDVRWINLDHVTRVTRSFDADSGEPILVLMFTDSDRLTIHGSTAEDVTAIDSIVEMLDECIPGHRLAA